MQISCCLMCSKRDSNSHGHFCPKDFKSFVSTIPPFERLGAENETRTRDPNLGKVVLYQLSYFRKKMGSMLPTLTSEEEETRTPTTQLSLPPQSSASTNSATSPVCLYKIFFARSIRRNEWIGFASVLRAENETRTRDPNLGKVVLYQLSYFRNLSLACPFSNGLAGAKIGSISDSTKCFAMFFYFFLKKSAFGSIFYVVAFS